MLNNKNDNQYFIIFIIVGLFFAFNLVAGASQQLTADEKQIRSKKTGPTIRTGKRKGLSCQHLTYKE